MKKTLIAMLLTSTAVMNSQAADNGFYAYASLGAAESSRKSEADGVVSNLVTTFTSKADESDTAYKLHGGYRFNRYLAIEGGYANLGKFSYAALATVPVASRDVNIRIDAWNVDGIGSLPISDSLSLFARLGLSSYKLKYRCEGTGVPCVNPGRTKHGIVPHYGVGMDWNFAPNWFARAEYEVYQDVGSKSNSTGTTGTSKANVRVGGVGLGYRF